MSEALLSIRKVGTRGSALPARRYVRSIRSGTNAEFRIQNEELRMKDVREAPPQFFILNSEFCILNSTGGAP